LARIIRYEEHIISSYLEWIRSQVGRQKILMVFASACLRDDAGRLLWQRRSDLGWWRLPGGVLELYESLPECVVREVREETGLTVEPTRLVGVYSSPDFDVTYPNGDQVQQVTACFECSVNGHLYNGQARVGHGAADALDETLELAWFDMDDPPTIAPWYEVMVADVALQRTSATYDRGRMGNGRGGEPYFRQVRQFIGSAAFVMPAAAAFVQNDAGCVLLQRRGDTGGWGLPGGAMELGERIDQTVVSEVLEETGLAVEPVRLIGVYSDEAFWFTYPHGDQVKVVSMLFECTAVGGALQPDGVESLEVCFFPADDLPPMVERHARRVADGLAGRKEAVF
jgi:ADP-ribose pyrophosphatase YjhB (NUDIX family)